MTNKKKLSVFSMIQCFSLADSDSATLRLNEAGKGIVLNSRQLDILVNAVRTNTTIKIENLRELHENLSSKRLWTIELTETRYDGNRKTACYRAGLLKELPKEHHGGRLDLENTVDVTPEKFPSLYKFGTEHTPNDLARIFGFPSQYRYIPSDAIYIMIAAFRQTNGRESTKKLWLLKTCSGLDALALIPKSSYAKPEVVSSFKGDKIRVQHPNGNTSVLVPEAFFDPKRLRHPELDKFLRIVNHKTLEDNYQSSKLKITLAEYMETLSLADRNKAEEKLLRVLEGVALCTCDYKDPVTKNRSIWHVLGFDYINGKGRQGSYAILYLDPKFLESLKNNSTMLGQYPKAILAIDDRQATAYRIATRFYLHKRYNANSPKHNEDVLTVRKLLEYSDLLTVEEVQQSTTQKRSTKTNVIREFVRALDVIEQNGIFSYTFEHPAHDTNHESRLLTDDELERIQSDFALFSSLVVRAKWFDESKADYSTIKRKKKRGRPPKTQKNT